MLGLYQVFRAGSIFLEIIRTAILVYCVLSWFRPTFGFFYWLRQFVMPFISPFQRLSLMLMRHLRAPVDFSCLFALIGISLINRVWWMIYGVIARMIY